MKRSSLSSFLSPPPSLLLPLSSSLSPPLSPPLPFSSSFSLSSSLLQTYLSVAVRHKLQNHNNLLAMTSSSLLLDMANLQWSIPPHKAPSTPMKTTPLSRAYQVP